MACAAPASGTSLKIAMEEQLIQDLKQALKNGDTTAVSVLRMLKSELTNARIAAGNPLSEEDILKVIRKEVKKRGEAATSFRSGNREEQARQEEAEAAILQAYLPAQADPVVVEAFTREAFAALPDHTPRQKGALIQAVRTKFGGQVDGKFVADLVNQIFTEAN